MDALSSGEAVVEVLNDATADPSGSSVRVAGFAISGIRHNGADD